MVAIREAHDEASMALIAHGLTDPRVAGAYPPDPYPGEDVDAYMARLIHTAPPSDLADQDDEVIDTSDPDAVRVAIDEASFAARLDSAVASGAGAAAAKERDSQAKRLVTLAADADLFHTPGGEPYGDVPVVVEAGTGPTWADTKKTAAPVEPPVEVAA